MAQPAAADLTGRLSERLNRLKVTRDKFVPELTPDLDSDPAARYRDLEFLRVRLEHTIPAFPSSEPSLRPTLVRAGASRFVRTYCQALVRAVLVGLAGGLGVNVQLDRVTMVWHKTERWGSSIHEPSRFHVGARDIVSNPSSTDVLESLFGANLSILFANVLEVVKLSPHVLWSSVAEAVGDVAKAADRTELDPDERQALREITDRVLNAEDLPGVSGPNPVRGHLSWEATDQADVPRGLMRRKVCCICFKLPDRHGFYCGACPIPDASYLIETLKGGFPAEVVERALAYQREH